MGNHRSQRLGKLLDVCLAVPDVSICSRIAWGIIVHAEGIDTPECQENGEDDVTWSGTTILTELLLLVHEGGAGRPNAGLEDTLVNTVRDHVE